MRRFVKVPISDVTTPDSNGTYELMKDRWWAVTEDDCILFYGSRGRSPQCNSNKAIVEHILSAENHPGVKAVFLTHVWLPHNCSDYI